jgi:hypothetical protein
MNLKNVLFCFGLAVSVVACSKSTAEREKKALSEQVGQQVTPEKSQACEASKSWFDGGFDPKKDAEAFTGGSLCAFHQFAWETFIWLTEKTTSGDIRFATMYADSAIFPGKQPGNLVLGGVNQAGSNGILVDQNGRAVYTTIMVNDIYRDFVIKHKLYTQQGLLNADPNLNFPDGAMSLKAAWKIVQAGEDTRDMFTMTAPVRMLSVIGKTVGIAKNAPQKTLKVALVGFHIAVYVKDHPEAIWATFEQDRNAPAFAKQQSPDKPVSSDNYTFYRGGTLAKDCNVNNSGMDAILKLNTKTQTIQKVTQACLQFPFGTNDSSPLAEQNRQAIMQLNKSVHDLMPSASVWKHYDEVGAVWFSKNNALKPNWNPSTDGSLLIGSTRLSNSTIETFTQNVRGQNECFGCHNTMALTDIPEKYKILPGKNVNTSHVLLQNYIDGNVVKR